VGFVVNTSIICTSFTDLKWSHFICISCRNKERVEEEEEGEPCSMVKKRQRHSHQVIKSKLQHCVDLDTSAVVAGFSE
jgi:hypothetical protein